MLWILIKIYLKKVNINDLEFLIKFIKSIIVNSVLKNKLFEIF